MTFEQFTSRYSFNNNQDVLGKGGFGTVYKAYDNITNTWVAVKMAEVLPQHQSFRLKNEFERACALPPHENIAQYTNCYSFTHPNAEYDYAIMQYYQHGNMQQLLEKNTFAEYQKIQLLKGILNGIAILHNNNVIHRDLKPENILIAQKPDGTFVPKITDFGISKISSNINTGTVNTTQVGTKTYSSPEQLLAKEIRKNTDLWSYGVIICKVFKGYTPFDKDTAESEAEKAEVTNQILNAVIPNEFYNIATPFNKVMELCLQKDPLLRVKDAAELQAFLNNPDVPIEILGNNEAKNSSNSKDNPYDLKKPVIKNENNDAPKQKLFLKREYETFGNYGFADAYNRIVIAYKYYLAEEFSNGLSKVGMAKSNFFTGTTYKYGFINELGAEVIEIKYDEASNFKEGLAAVKINGKYGFIDVMGTLLIPARYDDVGLFNKGLAKVKLNNKYGFIDKQDKMMIPLIYDKISNFNYGFCVAKNNGLVGVINEKNAVIIPFYYDYIKKIDNNYFLITKNGKYGCINQRNEIIVPFEYDNLRINSLFQIPVAACKNGKWGFINPNGMIVIDFIYYSVTDFESGRAVVEKAGIFKNSKNTVYLKDFL